MKKTLGTIVAAAAVVLLTATFGFAEYAATGAANFPYFQLGCLIIGGLILVSLKRKYEKLYTAEVVGAFALYTVLMALFTVVLLAQDYTQRAGGRRGAWRSGCWRLRCDPEAAVGAWGSAADMHGWCSVQLRLAVWRGLVP